MKVAVECWKHPQDGGSSLRNPNGSSRWWWLGLCLVATATTTAALVLAVGLGTAGDFRTVRPTTGFATSGGSLPPKFRRLFPTESEQQKQQQQEEANESREECITSADDDVSDLQPWFGWSDESDRAISSDNENANVKSIEDVCQIRVPRDRSAAFLWRQTVAAGRSSSSSSSSNSYSPTRSAVVLPPVSSLRRAIRAGRPLLHWDTLLQRLDAQLQWRKPDENELAENNNSPQQQTQQRHDQETVQGGTKVEEDHDSVRVLVVVVPPIDPGSRLRRGNTTTTTDNVRFDAQDVATDDAVEQARLLLTDALVHFVRHWAKTTTLLSRNDVLARRVWSVDVIQADPHPENLEGTIPATTTTTTNTTTEDRAFANVLQKLSTRIVATVPPPDLVVFVRFTFPKVGRRLDTTTYGMDIVHYQTRVRRRLQDLIRVGWTLTPRNNDSTNNNNNKDEKSNSKTKSCAPLPPMVFWDIPHLNSNSNNNNPGDDSDYDYVDLKEATTSTTTLNSLDQSVVQQLSDYYQLGYLAWPLSQSKPPQHGRTDHPSTVALWQYSLWQFTVDTCSSGSSNSNNISSLLLLNPQLQQRIEKIPPPLLDEASSLLTVSQQWEQQEQQANCVVL